MSRRVQDNVTLELIQLFLRWLHVTNEINKTGIIGIQDLKLVIQCMFDTIVAVESGVVQYGDCIQNSSLYSLQKLLLKFISSYNDYWVAIEAIYWVAIGKKVCNETNDASSIILMSYLFNAKFTF